LLGLLWVAGVAGVAWATPRLKLERKEIVTVPDVAVTHVYSAAGNAPVFYLLPQGIQTAIMEGEKTLGTYDEVFPETVRTDAHDITAVVRVGEQRAVIYNRRVSPLFDAVLPGSPLLSDGSVYFARDGQQWAEMIIDNQDQGRLRSYYTRIEPESIHEWKRPGPYHTTEYETSFIGYHDKKPCVVCCDNTHTERVFDEVTPPVITADFAHFAYSAHEGWEWMIELDDRGSIPFEAVTSPTIMPNGKLVYFGAAKHGRWSLMRFGWLKVGADAKVQPDGQKKIILYGPDGKPSGAVFTNGKTFFDVDAAGKPCDQIGAPVISPNGTRVVYPARQGTNWFLMEGDHAGAAYTAIGVAQFSPDSAHVLCPVQTQGRWQLLRDGAPLGPVVDELGRVQWSPDGAHVLLTARQGTQWLVLRDGLPVGPPADELGTPLWSPDSVRVLVSARTGTHWAVMLNGVPGPAYDAVQMLTWSRTGKSYAYAGQADHRWYPVFNGLKASGFTGIVGGFLNMEEYGRVTPSGHDLELWVFHAYEPADPGSMRILDLNALLDY